MANLFQSLEQQAFRAGVTPRTAQSRTWFQNKAKTLGNINRAKTMREKPLVKESDFIVGSMFMFSYKAKHAKTLPYWDKFPLAIVAGPAAGGFYGLNLHYLPLVLRAKFLDALLDVTNNKRYDDSTKFKMSYEMLKRAASMKYFEPCFKHYLNSQVTSHFAKVEAPEWEIAVFLPTQSFQKASDAQVWKDSRKRIK